MISRAGKLYDPSLPPGLYCDPHIPQYGQQNDIRDHHASDASVYFATAEAKYM